MLDLVGAADQTAIVGTSVGSGPAKPMWVYGVAGPQVINAGVATENDSAPGGTASNPVLVSGGIASEGDSATSATTLQGFFRRLDGSDDRINLTNGEALLWDDLTMAALVRKQRDGSVEWVLTNTDISGLPCISIGFNAANQVTMRLGSGTTVRKTTTNTVTMSDGWVIVAVTKAGGTAPPGEHTSGSRGAAG